LGTGVVTYQDGEDFPPLAWGELPALGHFTEVFTRCTFNFLTDFTKVDISDGDFVVGGVDFFDLQPGERKAAGG